MSHRTLLTVCLSMLAACESQSCAGKSPSAKSTVPSASTTTSASPSSSAPTLGPAVDVVHLEPLVTELNARAVVAAIDKRDWKSATDALVDVIANAPNNEDRSLLEFVRARLLEKQKLDGLEAYEKVSDSNILAPLAHARRALALSHSGNPDSAIAMLSTIDDVSSPFHTEVRFARGEAFATASKFVEAAAQFRLEREGRQGADATLREAQYVLVSPVPDSNELRELLLKVRKIRFEKAGNVAMATQATSLEQQITTSLDRTQTVSAPSIAEWLSSAKSSLDAGRASDAIDAATHVTATSTTKTEEGCKATMIMARALAKKREHSRAVPLFRAYIADCKEERVWALWEGGKSAQIAKQPIDVGDGKTERGVDVARGLFLQLETDFPKHRLADDARLRRAQILADDGKTDESQKLLSSLPDDFPEGDMRPDALFRLSWSHIPTGDWAGAIPSLQRAVDLAGTDANYFTWGRAKYFLARAKAETGAKDDAIALFKPLVTEQPLSFAGALAYEKLNAMGIEPKPLFDQYLASEADGSLFDPNRNELRTEGFRRAVALAKVGEIELAKRELNALGLIKESDPEGIWLCAAMFHQVGEVRTAMNMVAERTDFVIHAPSGKWRLAWEIAYPRPFATIVSERAKLEGVSFAMIDGIMREESRFDPDVASPANAFGLMQLIEPTAKTYATPLGLPATPSALRRPDVNIALGTAFLHKLTMQFAGREWLAVPSYNAGEGATERWLSQHLGSTLDIFAEAIPFEETRYYTKRVITSMIAYYALYEPASLDGMFKSMNATLTR